MEKEPILKLDNLSKDLNNAINRIDQIYAKYNMVRSNFNFDKLNIEDKNEITSIVNKVINPARNEQNYIQKLENIRHYAKVSYVVYKSSLKDILDSGGDPSKIGDTVETEIKNGDLTKTDAAMVSFGG